MTSYTGLAAGGPRHGDQLEAVTGKVVVTSVHYPSAKGYYVWHRLGFWEWQGWR